MKNIRLAIYFIGLGASLVIYAHANFSTRSTVERIEKYQREKEDTLRDDIKDIKSDIKFIKDCMIGKVC